MLVLMFVQFLRSWFLAFSLQMETSPRGRSSFAFQTALFKLCRFYSPSKLGKESLQSSFVFYDESCMLCLHDSQSDASRASYINMHVKNVTKCYENAKNVNSTILKCWFWCVSYFLEVDSWLFHSKWRTPPEIDAALHFKLLCSNYADFIVLLSGKK